MRERWVHFRRMGALLFGVLVLAGLHPPAIFAQSLLLPRIPLGQAPGAVAVDDARHLAIVADEALPGLYLVDLQTQRVVGIIPMNGQPSDVATDPALGLTLSLDPIAGTLDLTDQTTGALVGSVTFTHTPMALAVDASLHLAAVLEVDPDQLVGQLAIVDIPTGEIRGTVALGPDPRAVAIHTPTHQAVVIQGRQLLIVDLLTGKETGTIALPGEGTALAVLSDPAWAIVALQTPAGILLADLQSLTILAVLPLQSVLHAVVVHPVTGESFALDFANQALLRHDWKTGTLLETIPLGNPPFALALDPEPNLIAVTVRTPTGGALQLIQLPALTPPSQKASDTAGAKTGSASQPSSSQASAGPPVQDFTIAVAPSSATTGQGGSVAFQVTLTTSDGKPLIGQADLVINGLPGGVTPTFQPPVLAGESLTAILTLESGAVTAGTYPFTVVAITTQGGNTVTRTASASLTLLAPGTTALTGRIVETGRNPLQNVTVRLGTLTAMTDAGGNFLLLNPPPGDQLVMLDGSTASTATVLYPLIPMKVTIVTGQVTPLPYLPHLHAQKTTGFADIGDTGKERVLTEPSLPGFQLRIPAGAQIIGWDGKPNERVTVMTLPADRLPIPPPPFANPSQPIYMFFFDKPGGGVPNRPIPVTTPNDLGLLPGQLADLFYFDEGTSLDEATFTWRPAGWGRVSQDGKRIEPLPRTGLPRFCCGASFYRPSGPSSGPDPNNRGGDPVDLATGGFILQKTDLVVPWRIPAVISRYWRSRDSTAGPFDYNTYFGYDWYAWRFGANNENAYVILPGNYQYTFAKQPDGSYLNTTDPAYRGATLTFAVSNPAIVDNTATLRMKDGTTYGFDATGLLVSQTDRNGNRLTFARAVGDVRAIQDGTGRTLVTLQIVTSARDFYTQASDLTGRTVRYIYDGAYGRLGTVTYPDGSTHRYGYDTLARLTTLTDGRGIVFLRNEYDANDRVIRQTQADGSTYQFAYTLDGTGKVTQTIMTDPNGRQTTYRFNGSLYRTDLIDALGQTTTQVREAGTNLLLSTTDPLGRTTSYTYDSLGNVTSITDPAGNVRTFAYEPTFSQVASMTDPLGQVTTFTYDAQGNLTAITDPLGNRTTIAYNSSGQPVSVTDPLGQVTAFAYDTVGNLISTTDPLGGSTTRTYDALARLLSVTDPLGQTTQFGYDVMHRLTQLTDALGGLTRFTYDGNGNLTEVTDAKGHTVEHVYDAMDRLASRIDPLGQSEDYAYDANGNLTSFRDRKGQVATYSYDGLDRQTGANYADGSSASFSYDAIGRLTQAADSVGGTISNTYDVLGRLISQTTGVGTINYQYDALGRRTSMSPPGQALVTYSYDAAGRLTQVVQGSQTVGLDYDASGRRTRLTLPNGVSTDYQYDAASHLTALIYQSALGPLGNLTYTYDALGNRTAMGGTLVRTGLPTPVPNATYDAANRQLTFGDKTLTYDANGNLTSITEPAGVTNFTWDARNRLVNLAGPGLTASFSYDALGRRTTKTISGQTTQYLYDGADVVQDVVGGTSVNYLRGLNIDEPWVRNGTEFYVADALGSILGLTDATGALTTRYVYDPFGRTSVEGTPSPNSFQYTGRENDGTGLYYYRNRYYAPTLQRFLSPDPLRLRGGDINFYTYVRNRPLRFRDPLGLKPNDNPTPIPPWDPTSDPPFGPVGGPDCGSRPPPCLPRTDDDMPRGGPARGGPGGPPPPPPPEPRTPLNPWPNNQCPGEATECTVRGVPFRGGQPLAPTAPDERTEFLRRLLELEDQDR